jgi:hypothetical protein
VKKILVIIPSVILTLTLLLTNVTFAAGGKNEVALAQQAGQAWLDSTLASSGEPWEWIGAYLATPQVFCDLKGKPDAYMFAIENNGEVVGYIIVGSSAYGYPLLEASDVPPPSIPSADEVKSTLKKDLALDVASIGRPTRLLYLGSDNLFAIYPAGQQEVAVDLKYDFAMPASNLAAIDTMPSPEEYKANKEATDQARPEVMESSILTAQSTLYNCLDMSEYCLWWCYGGYYGCNPPLYNGQQVCWCGPSSGVSIGYYYKYTRGYSNLPSDCWMYRELFNDMKTDSTTGVTSIYNYGPGFIKMAQDHGYYNFWYYYYVFPPLNYYWTIVSYINSGWPTAMCATVFYEDVTVPPVANWPPKKSHFVVIKGYQSPYVGYQHVVICTDSYSPSNWLYLNWDYAGLFRCVCTIGN